MNHNSFVREHVANTSSLAIRVIVLLCIVLAVSSCRHDENVGNVNSTPPANQSAVANQNAQIEQSSLSSIDKGDLKLSYKPRKSFRPGEAIATNPMVLKTIIDNLNEKIALPWDITIAFENCDQPDAFYDPEKHSLTLCYELIDEYEDLFSEKIKDKSKRDEAVRGAIAATFFHELGHGLIDAWKLPVTGKEEDAVDQLSTLVLVNDTENGEKMALDGALVFKLYADLEKNEKKILWDEHSLDEQRFYDTICLIYGHDPEKYAYLVKDGTLPEERAELCTEDYPKIATSWRTLLGPYVKKLPPQQAASTPSQSNSNNK